MWFDTKMDQFHKEVLECAIDKAGFKPLRIDKYDHVNKIDDEIIVQIKNSRFILADFSGHRGDVYFEVGYAIGQGIPVVWLCNEKDLEDLHFDIRQYNCIVWKNEELEDKIKLKALISKIAFRIKSAC